MTDHLANDTDQPEGVPIAEAMARLRLSESSVRRRIRAKTLRAYKVHTPQGHEWRIILDDQPTTRLVTDADQPKGDGMALTRRGDQLAERLVKDRLRVVVEELQRTRDRVAALEAERPVYGPPDPDPPVVLRREEYPTAVESPPVEETDAPASFWARVKAFFGGGA